VSPEQAAPRPQNVILIGFMGSGKSTIGRRVAAGLRFEFVDTDAMIAENAGKSIREIFAADGESRFRDLESAALQSLANRSRLVISTGGGMVLRPENRALLGKLGFVVWLDAPEESIIERVSRNRERPLLLTENPRETVARLLRERRPVYRETAHLPVKTENLSPEEITHGIIESARIYFSGASP
jgi:shikimate kinase